MILEFVRVASIEDIADLHADIKPSLPVILRKKMFTRDKFQSCCYLKWSIKQTAVA